MTPQPAPKAFWDSGGDGVGVVFITLPSRECNTSNHKIRVLFRCTTSGSSDPPVEALPDLSHDLPRDDLHLHSLVRPHRRPVGTEDVVIGDGPCFRISICVVLPEILRHQHSPLLLTAEDDGEVKV